MVAYHDIQRSFDVSQDAVGLLADGVPSCCALFRSATSTSGKIWPNASERNLDANPRRGAGEELGSPCLSRCYRREESAYPFSFWLGRPDPNRIVALCQETIYGLRKGANGLIPMRRVDALCQAGFSKKV